MREGGLEAPTRHALDWRNPAFYDADALDLELRRVFDICHTCRRCFNLCDSFPRLFDLIDESDMGELDSVASLGFKPVIDACTLCDMCYMTKCPYVPPHEFNIDFPKLMLRYRAAEHRAGKTGWAQAQLAKTDRNGKLARPVAPLANWASRENNRLTRPLLEAVAGVHREAALPRFYGKTFTSYGAGEAPEINREAPARGRKAVLYATCFVNYNNPSIGLATRAVLARNGVDTEIVYPTCCGMPQLEHGDLEAVAARARAVAGEMGAWIERGYDIIALTPSCALMLKGEWPLLLPEDEAVARLAGATRDIAEYVVDIARHEGLAPGLTALDGGVALHLACHARAQNIGPKARDMLALIPDVDIEVIERCSGHGGAWGVMKDNFETAIATGKPVARAVAKTNKPHIASECPLAASHIIQGIERLTEEGAKPPTASHPIELFARAYGIEL